MMQLDETDFEGADFSQKVLIEVFETEMDFITCFCLFGCFGVVYTGWHLKILVKLDVLR